MAKYYVEDNSATGTFWYKDPEMEIRHRVGGPAIESAIGYKAWYKNGKLHREDGPAMELANGTKLWYKNGKLHREDGPAVEYPNGTCEYWLNGQVYFTKEEWEAGLQPAEELTVGQIEQLLGKRIKVIKENGDD